MHAATPSRRLALRVFLSFAIVPPALSLAVAAPVAAQGVYRISQRATMAQKLGGTLVTLDYSRPLARGRSDLFGKVVHWGELWTPGANEATVFEVSDTVTLNGHTVPAGRWSMWIIPSRVGAWELVLDARDSLFHTQRPELTDEQIRFPLEVRQDVAHVEALTWAFPRIAQDGATLRLNWGAMEIDLEVGVESQEPVFTVAAEEAAPYLGEWRVVFEPNPEGQAPPPAVLTVRHTDHGLLRASFPPGAFGPPPGAAEPEAIDEAALSPQERERAEARRALAALEGGDGFSYVLVPRAQGVFLLGWVDDGALLDVEEFYHEFDLEGGRAVGLTLRNDKDEIMGRATRVEQ